MHRWAAFDGNLLLGIVWADTEDLAVAAARKEYGDVENLRVMKMMHVYS